jgi:pteridine reductase
MAHAALITGGARRLGRAFALALAARGYDIALHYHASEADAQALAAVIDSHYGRRCVLLPGDLCTDAVMQRLVPEARAAFPALDLLINNASIYFPTPVAEVTPETFDAFHQLHVRAPFFLSQAFAQGGSGQIINLVDAQNRLNMPAYVPYQLSKKSLQEMTAMLAKALGPHIRVNAIAPGYILPPPAGNHEVGEASAIPLARTGQISDITAALYALLDQPYLTGQTLYVDGGQTL